MYKGSKTLFLSDDTAAANILGYVSQPHTYHLAVGNLGSGHWAGSNKLKILCLKVPHRFRCILTTTCLVFYASIRKI